MYEDIRKACAAYIQFVEGSDFHPDKMEDYENYIVEAAMMHFFGKDVYEQRINPAIERHEEETS